MKRELEIIQFPVEIPGKVFLCRLGREPIHWHQSLEVLFVLSGTLNAIVDDMTYNLVSADILVINSLSLHELYSEGAQFLSLRIDLSGSDVFKRYETCYFDCCSASDTENVKYDYLRHLLARLVKDNSSTSENLLQTVSLLCSLITELLDHYQVPRPDSSILRRKALTQLPLITDYINKNFHSGITLNDVAREFHFSQSHFSHFFKQNMNMTFTDYINGIRLDHAVNEIMSTRKTINDIALDNGFPDSRSLTKAFKKKYDMLPKEYRSLHASGVQPRKAEREINYSEDITSNDLTALAKYLEYDNAVPVRRTEDQKKALKPVSIRIQEHSGQLLKHTWRTLCCVSNSRNLLYSEVRQMLTRLQTDMPFSYIKFNGLLSDDLMLYSESADGKMQLSFLLLDNILDFLLSIKLKPVMELTFMPLALASDPAKTAYFTRQCCCDPKDLSRWCELVHGLILHCIERYSLKEVLTWPICPWYEPDTPDRFGFDSDESFLAFYRETYRTVKSIHPDLIFGTPALVFREDIPDDWYYTYFDFCRENDCVPDLINFHLYNDDVILVDDENGQKILLGRLSPDEDRMKQYLDRLKERFAVYGISKLPVWLTQWNLTVNHRNLISDTCFKSCFLAKNLLENYDRLDSFGYWALTDLLGEQQLADTLFHGGLGMMTVNGVPKAAYHAFRMISRLGDFKLTSGNGYFVTRRSGADNVQIILYNYYHYDTLLSFGEMFDMTMTNRYTAFSDMKALEVRFKFHGLESGLYCIQETFVNRNAGSSFDEWVRMGGIEPLSKEDLELLDHRSQPARLLSQCEVTDGHALKLQRELEPFEVRLIEIQKTMADTCFAAKSSLQIGQS